MREIVWLHISDFHLRQGKKWSQDVVLRALRKSIEKELAAGTNIDFILATGDLAFSGKEEEYALVREFFDALVTTSGVPRERIFCVPGNHDVNRDVRKLCFSGARSELINAEMTDWLLSGDNEDLNILCHRLKSYNDFQRNYFGGQSRVFTSDTLAYVSRIAVEEINIAIIGLNSAWLAEGGESDHGKLVLGERQVRNALKEVDNMGCDLTIVMLHHPFDTLRDFERETNARQIRENSLFLHSGHLHQSTSCGFGLDASGCLHVGAGAAFESRESQNSYSLVKLDLIARERKLTVFKYDKNQGVFESGKKEVHPISLTPGKLCPESELGKAITEYDHNLGDYAYYLSALLSGRKSEIPTRHQNSYKLVTQEFIDQNDEEYCKSVHNFFLFKNVLSILYGRLPLENLLQDYGRLINEFCGKLISFCHSDCRLAERIQQLNDDVIEIASINEEPSYHIVLISDLIDKGDYSTAVEFARRYQTDTDGKPRPEIKRLLAFALANSTDANANNEALKEYEYLLNDKYDNLQDISNYLKLLINMGMQQKAKDFILDAMPTIPENGLSVLHEAGMTIVQTGDQDFKNMLNAGMAKRESHD